MSLFENPKKAKAAFVITLIFAIIFLIGSGVLGYFFYKKYNDYKDLNAKYTKLKEDTTVDDLQKEIEELEAQIETLSTEKTSLEQQVTDKDAKLAKIKAYNEFFKYMNQVIETHNGFTGWTEAEYQIARSKAQATGNSSFVSTVDWAWHRTDIDPLTRLLGVWKAIVSGIGSAL